MVCAEETIDKEQFATQLQEAQQRHSARLQELLVWCLENNAKPCAEQTAAEVCRLDLSSNAVEQVQSHAFQDGEIPYRVRMEFLAKTNAARQAYADECYILGMQARNSLLVDEARQAAAIALDAWPDHHKTREDLLSQSWVKGYGWLEQKDAEQYAKGLRPLNDGWKPLKTVERERKRWDKAWELHSAHWILKTNTAEEIGLYLLDQLEGAYAVFMSEFGETLEALPPQQKMRMNLFASHDEFVKNIKIANPKLNPENINGQYDYQTRESYFAYFVNNDPSVLTNTFEQTCLHEAFHQLCHAMTEIDLWYATRAHFWITEGMADYFGGTFSLQDGKSTLGSLEHFKRHVSYVKMSQGGTVYDLEDFFALTQKEYHGNNGSAKYSQGYCLAYFMMHGADAKYAEKTRLYLQSVLRGKGSETLFEDIFGRDTLKPLEKEFKAFLRD